MKEKRGERDISFLGGEEEHSFLRSEDAISAFFMAYFVSRCKLNGGESKYDFET